MNFYSLIKGLFLRGRINRPASGATLPQASWFGGARVTPDVDHLQGPGIYFVAQKGAHVLGICPSADPAVAVILGGDGPRPATEETAENPSAGEGGLHYLGAWKVFLRQDGKLCLGAQVPTDAVALASKVQQSLLEIKDAFDHHTHAVSGGAAVVVDPEQRVPDPPDVASPTVKCV